MFSRNIEQRYPHLFAKQSNGIYTSQFVYSDEFTDENLISNVTIVPFVDEQMALLLLENGIYELIGGTREPNEEIMGTLKREVYEETGGSLVNFMPFGYYDCLSYKEIPYRSHLPHPRFCRLVGYGEIKDIGQASDTFGGIKIEQVILAKPEEAIKMFTDNNNPEFADLYKLAWELKEKNK